MEGLVGGESVVIIGLGARRGKWLPGGGAPLTIWSSLDMFDVGGRMLSIVHAW